MVKDMSGRNMCADNPQCLPKLSGINDSNTECWIRNIQDSVKGISSDGCHYVTPEICRELSHIDNGVAHIRLDHQLLDNKDWSKLCDQRRVAKHRQGVTCSLPNVADTLCETSCKMRTCDVHAAADTQVREAHHVTVQDLKQSQRNIGDLVHESVGRLKEYCDVSGVTDRYTGYRNNLTRGSKNPIILSFSWLNKPQLLRASATSALLRGMRTSTGNACTDLSRVEQEDPCPPGYCPQQQSNSCQQEPLSYCCGQPQQESSCCCQQQGCHQQQGSCGVQQQHNSCQQQSQGSQCPQQQQGSCCNRKQHEQHQQHNEVHPRKERSIQEQSGINIVFPGLTEYLDRYRNPSHNTKVTHYVINPKPDFNVHGRKLLSPMISPGVSEYEESFPYPDADKLALFPWKR